MPYDLTAIDPSSAPPRIDASLFQDPQDAYHQAVPYGKLARETRATDMHNQLQNILTSGTGYANYLTAIETARHNQSLDTLTKGMSAFNEPYMTDADVRRLYSGEAAKSGRQFSANLGQLRGALGASGVGGDSGMAAALAGRYQAQRAASNTDAKMSLYQKRIDMDVQRRKDLWLAQQAVAAKQGEEPSAIGLDWLSKAGSTLMDEYGIQSAQSNAKHLADAQKQAGQMALGGDIFKSLLTAVA